MKLEIISANRLSDGRVVYLTRDGDWSESIIDARSARDTEESTALLADAEHVANAGIIVSPYLVSMADDGGAFAPLRFRERIRLFGPGTRKATTSTRKATTSARGTETSNLSPQAGR